MPNFLMIKETTVELAVEMLNVTKIFGERKANDDVSIAIKKGEIHAIVGENGAGKSTIVKILHGFHRADSGKIKLNGKLVNIVNSEQAMRHGVGMVYQNFMLIDSMSVLDNILLSFPTLKQGIVLDYAQSISKIRRLSNEYNFKFDLDKLVGDLGVGTKQRLEIFKNIYRNSDILILDEPTSVLTKLEVQDLFDIMQKTKQQNKTIIIITHKLDEVMAIADKITIMRAAKVVAVREKTNTSIEELATLMIGQNVPVPRKTPSKNLEDILTIKDLNYVYKNKNVLTDINLTVSCGQIVGIAGISGNGQVPLEEILAGMLKKGVSGKIIYKGEDVLHKGTKNLREARFAHIPSDRHRWAYIKEWKIYKNFILGYQFKKDYSAFSGWLKYDNIREIAFKILRKFKLTPLDIDLKTDNLSGGNQQKTIVSREMESNPDFILIAEPTQGVDIGSVAFIHEKILEAKEKSKAILLISSELEEIKALADRSFVISAGKIVGEIDWSIDDEKSIGIKMLCETTN